MEQTEGESSSGRRVALLRVVLVLTWGTVLAGVALLALFAVAAVGYYSQGQDAVEVHVIAWWLFITGLGVGCGYSVAFMRRKGLGRGSLAAIRQRPVRSGLIAIASVAGIVLCDFVRCDLAFGMPNYGGWVFREFEDAERAAGVNRLSRDEAKKAMTEALDGVETDMRGWTFRIGMQEGKSPPGRWYFLTGIAHGIQYQGRPPAGDFPGDNFDIFVIVQPRSIGARLSALRFNEEARIGSG